ncbi:molybdopterin-dependent oxidoreductase, partial [Flavihumibacter sediminis]|nr:molybdopterin-dependent oxidoreductase [Flavihumibacter sediminis]
LFQRIAAARSARPELRVVVIDPRRTATCDIADMHLAVRGDGDAALFNGLLAHLVNGGHVDAAYVDAHVAGFDAAVAAAKASDPSESGIEAEEMAAFYR